MLLLQQPTCVSILFCSSVGFLALKKKNQRSFQSFNGFENNIESSLYCRRG